jgi:NTE family protein
MTDQPVAGTGAQVAQAAAEFQWDGNKFESGIGISLSGGGFRAMLFHAGALMRLNELGILSRAKRISGVSGGSIAAGYLAAVWRKLGTADANGVFEASIFKTAYVDPIFTFSRNKIDVIDALTGLLPWTSAAAEVATEYERYLFGTRTLQDLPDQPRFVFCATNLQTGVLWRFSKPYAGDYVVGRLDKPDIRLSQAVAASSAFPPVLSPMILKFPPASFTPWAGAPGAPPQASALTDFQQRVMLTDGGVYDNHGVEPLLKRYATVFVSDGGAPFGRRSELGDDWISQLRRILDVTDNQVRALRRRDLIARFIEGNAIADETKIVADRSYARMGAYWGIDTDPAKINPPDALPCNPTVTHRLALVGTRLSDLGEQISKQIINWGYVVCDRSLRTNYKGSISGTKPTIPFSEAGLV